MIKGQGKANKAQHALRQAMQAETMAAPAEVPEPPLPRMALHAAEPPRIRLLVIDDDTVAREAVRRALEESGLLFELAEAIGGDDGNRALHEGEFDCVLLDYRFPEGDALDLFAAVMSRSCDSRPPIVMLTGVGDERIAASAIKQGAQDYMSKIALSAASLRRTIEDAMDTAGEQLRLKQQNDLLHRLSLYDSLTDLPNRNLFFSRLKHKLKESARRSESFAVLMLDLNGFKEINDIHGHAMGDQVLRTVARRLTESTRDSDTMARHGGDEFAGILSVGERGEDVMMVASKLCRAVAEPMTLLGTPVMVGLSIGIALFPRDGLDSETLLRHADLAMYSAKRRSTGFAIHGDETYTLPGTPAAPRKQAAQLPELGQFEVYYEPQVVLATRALAAVEAHVRWRHPELGLLLPEKFTGAAQLSATVHSLTAHIAACAVKQVCEWREEGMRAPLSLNLSPSLLGVRDLPASLLNCLATHQLSPDCLTIEIAESGIMEAGAAALATLRPLTEAGVRIAIDDFGAGFSSSRYKFALPVAEIKIDKTFVYGIESDPRHQAIVRSIIEYGREIGAKVAAEGVDTDQARLALCALGCEFGQGALFSAPVSAVNYRYWHRRWQAKSGFAMGAARPAKPRPGH